VRRSGARDGPEATSIAALLLAVTLVSLVVRETWFSDDSFFTIRSSLNLHHGDGPVLNPGDRTQAFSNPLWMLLISIAPAGRSLYWCAVLSWLLVASSVAALIRVASRVRATTAACCVLLALLFSRTFVDYGTSGLETPLSCFLVAATVTLPHLVEDPRKQCGLWGGIAGLSYLCRPDLVLITFLHPAITLATRPRAQQRLRHWLFLLLPSAAIVGGWILFSLVYYGFPFPSPAYAKLSHDVARWDVLLHGMGFLGSFVSGDLSAVSLLGITASLPLVVLLSQRRRIEEPGRRWHRIVPSLGPTLLIVVTVAYTVWIGGDHMNGRFYLPILTLSAFAYVLHERELPEDWRRISRTVLVSASLLSPVLNGQATRLPGLARFGTTVPYALTPLRHVNERDECWRFGGSLDEKCAYKHRTYFWGNAFVEEHGQVLAWLYEPSRSTHEAVELAPVGAGHASLLVGPNRTKWDDQGLSDQYQARMPVIRGTSWRAGHFIKFHPREERWASFVAGTGRFGDRELDQLFNAVHLVATGPLWSAERWREIARLNLGGYASILSTIGARYGRPTPENCRRSNQPHLCLRDIGRPGS
jgi:arabinofuranosyltransferase